MTQVPSLVDLSHLSATLSSHPALAIPVLFAGGVLASFTPCIYPMIPITVAIVGGEVAAEDDTEHASAPAAAVAASSVAVGATARPRPTRWRPLALTLTYVLGLALVYSALGLVAGLSGTLFGAVSTNPWLYFAMANVLVLAALAMLDVIPIRVPSALLQHASTAGTAGRFSGAFVMGAMSGLVAAPCGAPVMAAVLTWVTTTKSAVLGFVYLFAFSLGMCALLVVAGVFSGTLARLPRAGFWMVWVKRILALVMLGVAEYYLVKMGQVLI